MRQCNISTMVIIDNIVAECFDVQVSNFVLTSEGQVVIGHNLITESPQMSSMPLPATLDDWLKNLLFYLLDSVSVSWSVWVCFQIVLW